MVSNPICCSKNKRILPTTTSNRTIASPCSSLSQVDRATDDDLESNENEMFIPIKKQEK